jgi:transcriptional antiterminator RfaH
MNHWYLLRTKTNAEQQSHDHLERQGYEAYFPRFIKRIRRMQQRTVTVVPLFPGYVFVALRSGEQSLSPVKSTRGVLSVVRFGDEYAIVPERVISQIKYRADARGLHSGPHTYPRPRDKVRVTQGPFEGVEAIFVRECGEARVLVLLDILGQERSMQLPEHVIELQSAS